VIGTTSGTTTVCRRDELFARIARDGEWVADRGDDMRRMLFLGPDHLAGTDPAAARPRSVGAAAA
jgi:hypothetical protein